VRVVAADGGVHLDGNARLVGPLNGLDGARPRAGQAAEGVVNLGRRAVERDAEPHQAGFLQLEDRFARQQRRGAGRERHLHAFAGGVADQLEDVFALQRIAAGKHEDRHVHVGDLVDQRLAFGVGQLVGVGDGLGGGAAVLAGQVAGLRDLPDGQKRRFVVSSIPPRAGMLCIGCIRRFPWQPYQARLEQTLHHPLRLRDSRQRKGLRVCACASQEFGADLILFHAYDTLVVAASETSGIRYYDYAAAARTEKSILSRWPSASASRPPLRDRGPAGLPADQILAFLREREIDRVVMGTHSPGPIGKLLVGSVAEAVLRTARSPVYIVGPDVVDGELPQLCHAHHPLRRQPAGGQLHVAAFAAELAASTTRA
jgi:nucleotide-binding universal stress UspA family protein